MDRTWPRCGRLGTTGCTLKVGIRKRTPDEDYLRKVLLG